MLKCIHSPFQPFASPLSTALSSKFLFNFAYTLCHTCVGFLVDFIHKMDLWPTNWSHSLRHLWAYILLCCFCIALRIELKMLLILGN